MCGRATAVQTKCPCKFRTGPKYARFRLAVMPQVSTAWSLFLARGPTPDMGSLLYDKLPGL